MTLRAWPPVQRPLHVHDSPAGVELRYGDTIVALAARIAKVVVELPAASSLDRAVRGLRLPVGGRASGWGLLRSRTARRCGDDLRVFCGPAGGCRLHVTPWASASSLAEEARTNTASARLDRDGLLPPPPRPSSTSRAPKVCCWGRMTTQTLAPAHVEEAHLVAARSVVSDRLPRARHGRRRWRRPRADGGARETLGRLDVADRMLLTVHMGRVEQARALVVELSEL